MSSSSRGFLRPSDEDFASSWKEDRTDLDAQKDASFVFNPTPSMSLAAQRQRLPIAKHKDHILYLAEKHRVVIIVGETGCGKSTQVPQFFVEAGWCSDDDTMVSVSKLMQSTKSYS